MAAVNIITRFVAGIAFFVAVIAIVLAFVAQDRYRNSDRRADHLQVQLDAQFRLIDALADGYQAQGQLNNQVVASQKTLTRAVRKLLQGGVPVTATRSLAGTYP